VKCAIRASTPYPPPLLNTKRLGDLNQRAVTQSPYCLSCPDALEDVNHLILECPARAPSRLAASMPTDVTSAYDAIVTTPQNVAQFLQLEGLI